MKKMEHFTLKAMLMWGIHDFPAFGSLSGCVTHGYKACPVCADNTESIFLTISKKVVYINYRWFLPMDHPFRQGKYLGLKTKEERPPPSRLKGQEILAKLSRINYVPGKIPKSSGSKRMRDIDDDETNVDGGEADCDSGEVTEAWYKKSIFWGLPYWKDHKVRHVIDVMHSEKIFTEHILNTILDVKDRSKDTVKGREDMRVLGIHRNQWMQTDTNTGKQIKPKAPFVLDKEEKTQFLQTLSNLKLPSGFSSNLSNIVNLESLSFRTMKSHDYHVIMQYLLPVMLQHAYPNYRDLRRAFQQISLFFKLICSKVLDRKIVQDAKYMVAEALCVLEKYFPPTFFDISIHHIVHLADEALICGPVPFRWMYPFERYVKLQFLIITTIYTICLFLKTLTRNNVLSY
jgi:hypothetical protein